MKLPDRKPRCVTTGVVLLLLMLSACSVTPGKHQLEFMRQARAAEASYQSGKLGGKLDAARKKYEALLAANPRYATAHIRLGAIAYREGDAKTARVRFERAIGIDPKNSQAKYNLAVLNLGDAAALLNDYASLAPPGENRRKVLALLSHLNDFASQ